MSVIVNDTPIDLALRIFSREANKENLFDVVQANRYRIKQSFKNHEERKVWAKMKRRRNSASRKLRRKGIGI